MHPSRPPPLRNELCRLLRAKIWQSKYCIDGPGDPQKAQIGDSPKSVTTNAFEERLHGGVGRCLFSGN